MNVKKDANINPDLLFSVVMPLYNKEKHIKRAVDSVLSQATENIELIVVDDGSADRGVELVKQYTDRRIKLIEQKNAGVSAARNKGIQEARGDYITFLDADDAWKPDYLETITQLIKAHPQAGAFATAYEVIGLNGKPKKPRRIIDPHPNSWTGSIESLLKEMAFSSSPIHTSSICVLRRVLLEIGGFPLGVVRSEDTYTWLKVAFKYPIAYTSKVCTFYYRGVENSASNQNLLMEIPYEPLLRDAVKKGTITGKAIGYVDELLAKMNLIYATRFLLANKMPLARDLVKKARTKQLKLLSKKFILLVLSYFPYPIVRTLGERFTNIKIEFAA